MKYKLPEILKQKTEYTFDYPESIEIANKAMSIFWTPEEISIEKDLHQFKTGLTESEKHGVITVLKLFTLYEIIAGNEFWANVIVNNFPRHDIIRPANCFSFFELNVHAPFYNKLNEVLGLATDEFYNSYVKDKALKERMDWIDNQIFNIDRNLVIKNNKILNDTLYLAYVTNLLKSIATFSLIEGVVLYSSFAYLKHFQAAGKNLLTNTIAGINFSVRDENIHAEYGQWLFKQLMQELTKCLPKDIYVKLKSDLQEHIDEVTSQVAHHESLIIDKIFEKGEIKGISSSDLKKFVLHRLLLCTNNLLGTNQNSNMNTEIEAWFYLSINAGQFNDFFVRIGNEYKRDWDEQSFNWIKNLDIESDINN